MTTCPRCGRVADDEFVCADCGAFLAGGEGEDAPAVRVGRVAVLVLVVCLLGAVGAVVLLSGGGGGHRADPGIPLISGPVELSSAPLGVPGESGPGNSSGTTIGSATASASSSASSSASPSPTKSSSASARRSTSAAPTSVRPSSSTPRSSSPAPHPSTSHSSPSPPPSTSQPPPPQPVVRLAKGGPAASCGQHCYSLVVSLTGFGGGSHNVSCFSGHTGEFGHYSTTAATSTGCSYGHPHDTVWVIVDGTRSNTVAW